MRFLTSLSVLFVLLFAFSCNDNGTKPAATAPVGLSRPVGLKVMTWRYLPQDQQIIQAFESRFRIRVEVIVKPMKEIVAAAQQGVIPDADVLFVPSIEDATRLRGFGVLQPFFVDVFTRGEVGDRDLDNEGYYAGVTRWTMAAVYNPKAITGDEAASYLGIAKAAGRGARVGVAHPDSSGLAGLVGGLATNLSQEAAAIWARTIYTKAANGLFGSDEDQMNRMLAGELDMALVSSGVATRWILNGNPRHYEAGGVWRISIPATEASNVNFPNLTCVTVPANTPRRVMALNFINSLYTKENQQILTDAWFEYPAYAFGVPNQYLNNYRGVIGTRFSAEMTEQATPLGWALINEVAESTRE